MNPFGTGANRICGVAAAATSLELKKLLRAALSETRTVELRLDWLKNDTERNSFLKWLSAAKLGGATLIATCRRRIGGGELAGDAEAELFWLMKAREAGCSWCDLEIETLRELPGQTVEGLAIPPNVMISMHDFRRTPQFKKKLMPPGRTGSGAVKVAAMSRSIGDSVRLLRLAGKSGRVVVAPMGELGLPARLLSLREGSAIAYAPVAAATAPGQVSLTEVKSLYRAHQASAKTQVYGVIGSPVGHSLSPLLHNTGYIAAGKDAIYLPFLVEKLMDFLKAVPELGVRGFSVTIPHKESVFRKLDDCEPLAERIGAVNTITVRRDGTLYGSNTDYLGVLRALERQMNLAGKRVLIFGAGGSARAAAFAVSSAGAEVFISARRDAAANSLARDVGGEAVVRSKLGSSKFDAILNATPVGMHPQDTISPLSAGELNCSLVMDLIYRPLQTKLLRLAAAKGLRTVSGVEMFLSQGIAQWEHWMRCRAPESSIRRAVLAALKAREKSSR